MSGEENSTTSLRDLGLESYDVVEVHRSELKGADYNPRILGDAEKRHLKDGLKRHGIVAPITWNRTTGNLVGGHQRLSVLDALAGTKDYTLRVAAIEVVIGREKELNVLLNNPSAMGDWDIDKLGDILRDFEVDLVGTGFDHADVFQIFGDTPMQERDAEQADELAQKIRDTRELYSSIQEKSRKRDSPDFYFLAIFRNAEDRNAFLERAHLPENKFQSGEALAVLCGIENFREESG